MIAPLLAALALQANPYEAVNPTIPYSQCMMKGLSARLSGAADIDSAKRLAAYEQTLAECAAVRASALARVDLMLSGMKASDGSRPDPRFTGTMMMGVWDKSFLKAALDPAFRWDDDQARKPGK